MKKLTGLILLSGSAISDTNINYLSGFSAPDRFLFLQTDFEKYLVVSTMEKGRAQKQSKSGVNVLTPNELGLSPKKATQIEEQIIALLEKINLKRIKVPSDFPVGIFQTLEKRGIQISVQKNEVCPERKVKSKPEISKIRLSQKAAVAAMNAAIEKISSSSVDLKGRLCSGEEILTSEKVRQIIHKTLMEYDCIGMDTIVAGGNQATDPHEQGFGPLFAGESIIMDIFPKSGKTGYWGDLTRTVCYGKANPKLKKLYLAVKAAQQAALAMVKPGVCADEVHLAAVNVFKLRGYETKTVAGKNVGFIHGTGHGVGLDIHEFPRIGKSGEMLEEGNVITIEPGLYYPGLGGVRIEDTIVVTKTGWRYLATCPKFFEIL